MYTLPLRIFQIYKKPILKSNLQQSLARALYSKPDLLILDDIFSGLDNTTEQNLFTRVFGPDGIIRRLNLTTVLATHAG